MKKLSIYVMTYKRPILLGQCLESIRVALGELSSEEREIVEVVISENPSSQSDLTEVLREYKDIIDSYSCNIENIGPDENYYASSYKCEGEFIWTLGDDDLLVKSALKIALNTLVAKADVNVGVLSVGRIIEDMVGNVVYLDRLGSVYGVSRLSNKEFFANVNELMVGISIIIFRRCPSEDGYFYKNYSNSMMPSMAIALDRLEKYGDAFIIYDKIVRFREGDRSDWSWQWSEIKYVSMLSALKDFCDRNEIGKDIYDPYKESPMGLLDVLRIVYYKGWKNKLFFKSMKNYLVIPSFYVGLLRDLFTVLPKYTVVKLFMKIKK